MEAVILILAGLFAIAGGVYDWDWFMKSEWPRLLVRWWGRTTTRWLYIGLGLVLCGGGIIALVL